MDTKELSIIIPAYLEEANLRVILPRLSRVLKKLVPSFEILVIDTMTAKDNTVLVCKENGALYMNRAGGNNYGDAVRTGIASANSNYSIFMDADGSHDPEFIAKLYDGRTGYDVVIASRYTQGGDTKNDRSLMLMSLLLNKVYSIVLGLKCKDVSNSFKLYRTADLKMLSLKCNNFDIVEEILFKLKKAKGGLKIQEIPFIFHKRMFGDTKRNLFVFIFTYIVTIVKLRFSK